MFETFIAKAPLRLPLGGGGTDIDSFYTKEPGFWISGTIDKYIYVVVRPRFERNLRIAYSALEYVDHPSELEHPVIREALLDHHLTEHVEIATFADLPSRLGLGSSGCFTVALLHALAWYTEKYRLARGTLAENAYRIEHDKLNRPIGKQDQYSAAFGSLRGYHVQQNGNVIVDKPFETGTAEDLQDWLLLFYVNRRNQSINEVLSKNTYEDMQEILRIGWESHRCIKDRDFLSLGLFMSQHWEIKRKVPCNEQFDSLIQLGRKLGAEGGKLIGAGGGGCLLFVCEPVKKESVVKGLTERGLTHIPFKFVHKGSEVTNV